MFEFDREKKSNRRWQRLQNLRRFEKLATRARRVNGNVVEDNRVSIVWTEETNVCIRSVKNAVQ